MAKDRTLLAFISVGAWARGPRVYVPVLEDQFVNSALIRTRLGSGICFSNYSRKRKREKECKKYKTVNINMNALHEKRVLSKRRNGDSTFVTHCIETWSKTRSI